MNDNQPAQTQTDTLAVSDLQLLLAFYMRNGVDLSNWIISRPDCYELIFSNFDFQDIKPILGDGVTLMAKFDKEGKTIFIKYDVIK